MSRPSSKADALFAEARRLDVPDVDARARMRRAVLERAAVAGASLGAGAVASSLAAAPVTKAATWSAALVVKIVVPLLLVGTAVTGAVTLTTPTLAPSASFESPSRSVAPAQALAGDRAPRAVVALAPTVTGSTATAAATAPIAVEPRARSSSWSTVRPADADDATSRAELRDLQAVERLLARGDAEAALAVLDGAAGRRQSIFTEEIDGARVLALCASTRASEAARARASFTQRYPVSPLASRIARACASTK